MEGFESSEALYTVAMAPKPELADQTKASRQSILQTEFISLLCIIAHRHELVGILTASVWREAVARHHL